MAIRMLRRGSWGSGRLARRTALRLPGLALLLAVAAVVASLALVSAASAGVLDQSQPAVGAFGRGLVHSTGAAQTFMAGKTGNLDRVEIAVKRSAANASVPLTLELRAVSSGVPTDLILASTSVSAASIPAGSATFVSFPLAAPAGVTAGVEYAIVLAAPGCGSVTCYVWAESDDENPYPAGLAMVQARPGAPWEPLRCCDFAFKTYVAVPAVGPTSKQQCKKGRWKGFTNPSFKNQGQCVAYLNHHNGKGKDDQSSGGKKRGKGKRK